jgi:hypothetical protein
MRLEAFKVLSLEIGDNKKAMPEHLLLTIVGAKSTADLSGLILTTINLLAPQLVGIGVFPHLYDLPNLKLNLTNGPAMKVDGM